MVYSWNNEQLGILLNATPTFAGAAPGFYAYVSYGDKYTLVNDGLIVPATHGTIDAGAVFYTNNDCTGTPYVTASHGYVPIANYVYLGYGNVLYTAATTASPALAVQSYSTGEATCTVDSFA